MKSIVLLISVIFIISCNHSEKKEGKTDSANQQTEKEMPAENINNSDGPVIINGNSDESRVITSGKGNLVIVNGDTITSDGPIDTVIKANGNVNSITVGNGNKVVIEN